MPARARSGAGAVVPFPACRGEAGATIRLANEPPLSHSRRSAFAGLGNAGKRLKLARGLSATLLEPQVTPFTSEAADA